MQKQYTGVQIVYCNVFLNNLAFSCKIMSFVCFLFPQSALRFSNQTEFPEWEYSDDSSDSEDDIPRDQVLETAN